MAALKAFGDVAEILGRRQRERFNEHFTAAAIERNLGEICAPILELSSARVTA